MKKHFKGLTKNTFLLTITSLFADISTEMLYPVLPIFLTQYLKSSGSMVGIIEGVATATQYIQMGISGWISDKIKMRKPLAVIGYILAALSKPLIGLSTVWTGVLGARFMDRLGTGTRSAPRYALVAESANEKDRGKAFGLEGLGDNLGAFLGPLLAIVLLFYFNVEIRHIFLLAIIPGSIAVLMILLVKEEKQKVKVKYKISANIKNLPKKYWKYITTIAVFGIGNLSSSFLILQIRNAGVPLIYTILIYAFFNLVAAAVSYPIGSLSDKLGRKKILLFSFLVFLISLIGFAVTKNIFVFAFLFALYGIYQGIFRAVGNAFASDFVPEELEATAIGWFNATVGLSGLVASVMAGLVYDKIGHSAIFITSSVFVFLGTIAMSIFV
ncbi:MAG TPA: MFS transporter [Candidatus Saccharimonadales bacterium]|nr:MFS transporter [Candidatus Saccharimonadales bacterium]